MTAAAPETTTDDVRWLYDLLGADVEAEPRPFLARPSLDSVQLLLPTAPAPVAAGALRRLHGGRELRAQAEMWAGRALGRLGLLSHAPGESVMVPRFELVDHLARVLGEPELIAAVTIGPPRRNRKPVLQLLRPDGRIAGFAKIGWSELTTDLVTNEASILRTIDGRLPPSIVAPCVLAVEHWRDLAVVVTAELRPSNTVVDSRPTTSDVMRTIAELGPISRIPVDQTPTLVEGRRLGLGEQIDLDRVVARHGDVVLDTGLWHGDFTPWNLMRKGRSVLIWDWEFAGWNRPVLFDALHHHFEANRRAAGGTNRSALTAVLAEAPNLARRMQPGIDREQLAAIVDLYLCELINRELQLTGQRWSGGALATLGNDAIAALRDRLA